MLFHKLERLGAVRRFANHNHIVVDHGIIEIKPLRASLSSSTINTRIISLSPFGAEEKEALT